MTVPEAMPGTPRSVWDLPFDLEAVRASGYEGTEAEAWALLGQTLEAQGRNEEALAAYHSGIAADAENSLCAYYLGNMLNRTGDLEGAVAALRYSAVRAPDHWVTHLKLGQALAQLGDPEGAVLAFTCAHTLSPRSVSPLSERGRAYVRLGLGRMAAADVEKALQLEPNSKKLRQLRDELLARTADGAEHEAPQDP